jgi:hypothetical protein
MRPGLCEATMTGKTKRENLGKIAIRQVNVEKDIFAGFRRFLTAIHKDSWEAHLDKLGFKRPKHRRIATEGALIGSLLEHGSRQDIVIVSDDAGQFNVFLHALCWVHTERLIHKLIPLNDQHPNGSETDIRDYVKKKKVSGGTRSDDGRRCRDTFASLKKTCRKLKISFWEFLNDRVLEVNSIPPLPEIVRQKMVNKTA